MPLTPNPPQREITPEERKRTARTFWLILLLFPTLVGTMIAYISVKGRAVRDYGHEVLAAAQKQTFDPSASYNSDCTDYLKKPAPADVKECKVQVINSDPEVVITLEGERKYHIR